jgi:hypothetical protein
MMAPVCKSTTGSSLRYSVFSDLRPHTALISSFARGANFPTWYPHFPMDGIRYIFCFTSFVEISNFWDSTDWAINLPSLVGRFCALLVCWGFCSPDAVPPTLGTRTLFLRSRSSLHVYPRPARRGRFSGGNHSRDRTVNVFVGKHPATKTGDSCGNVYANHPIFCSGPRFCCCCSSVPAAAARGAPAAPSGRRTTPALLRTDAWLPPFCPDALCRV